MPKYRNPLRKYREKWGLSQQEIANRLKVSRSLVGLLETGGRDFTADMAIRIEKKLGIDRARLRPEWFRRRPA